MLRVVGTCKNPLNIVNCHVRLVLAAMQKTGLCFCKSRASFVLFMHVKLLSKFEPSPVLAAVHKQYTCFTFKKCSELLVLLSVH